MGQLGTVLRSMREDAGLTQEELADRAGLSTRTISDVERGLRKRLYRHTAERLADALSLAHEHRSEFVELARGRASDGTRDLDAAFKRRFVAWHVDRISALADKVGDEENWYAVLDADEANLTVALRWAHESGDAESLLQLGAGLFRYWQARGALTTGREWLERGLKAEPAASSGTRMAALWGLAWLAYQQGDDEAAGRCADELAELARETGDPTAHRNAATVTGIVALARGDSRGAQTEFERALEAARESGDAWIVATSALNLGIARIGAGDTAAARTLISEALQGYDDLGDDRFRARCLGYLGLAALVDDDPGRADALYAQSLLTFEDLDEAKGIAEALTGFAAAAAARGLPLRAAQLGGAAEQVRESFGGRPLPVEGRVAEAALHQVREHCEGEEWAAAWTSGRALRRHEAIALALDGASG